MFLMKICSFEETFATRPNIIDSMLKQNILPKKKYKKLILLKEKR